VFKGISKHFKNIFVTMSKGARATYASASKQVGDMLPSALLMLLNVSE